MLDVGKRDVFVLFDIRRYSDDGRPVLLAEPESPSGVAFDAIVGRVAQQVSIQAFKHIALTIVEE